MNVQVMSVLYFHSLSCYKWQGSSDLMMSLQFGRKMLRESIKQAHGNKRKLPAKTSLGNVLNDASTVRARSAPSTSEVVDKLRHGATPSSTPVTGPGDTSHGLGHALAVARRYRSKKPERR